MFCGLALSRTRLRVTLCLRLISTHPIAYKRSLAPHSSLYFTLKSLSHVVFTPVLQLISMRTSGLASESDLRQAQTSFFPQRFVFLTFASVTSHSHHSALWAGLMTVRTFGQTMLCWQHLSLRSMAERLLVSIYFSSTQVNQTHSRFFRSAQFRAAVQRNHRSRQPRLLQELLRPLLQISRLRCSSLRV